VLASLGPQHCSVHRARNLIAKLPEQERERVRRAYWQALDEAKAEREARERLEALVSELERAGGSRCRGRALARARIGPIEIHCLHVPFAANGWVKPHTLQAIRAGLHAAPARPRVVCGDLNTPRRELENAMVLSFASRRARPRHATEGRNSPERDSPTRCERGDPPSS
jgi:endonuclease/exonuclease/phosphatase family metal-dependent hydrolase